jgi:hypothetical protein
MAINLFSILRRKITNYDELLDNDLQTLADAIDNIAPKAPTLQDVTNEGNITTNDINLDKSAIVLANGSRLLEGIIDNGASGGIARECAVLYQDQWENGIQYFINQAARIVQATSINNTVPDANLDITRGYDVNSIFYDLNSNQKYICTDNTEAAAVWDLFFDAVATDGVTITGDGTSSNPLVAVGGGGGTVNYANVLFVDSTNGNNGTAAQNDFTKPYSDTNPAMNAAALLTPTATNRTLIYVRRGNYSSFINLQDNTDWYCEPGVVFTNVSVDDGAISVNAKFMGKAVFTGYGFQAGGLILRAIGATSKVYFEFDEINTTGGAIEINSGASATIVGRKIFSETFNKGFGITTRGSGTVTINVTEEIAAWHQVFAVLAFSGKLYVTCPRIYLHEGNTYGGDFKQVIAIRNSLGGEVVINGDLIVNPLAGYYGGISGAITRWTDSFGTLRLNGNIYAENQFGVYGLGSSGASRTIINGDVRSNHLCAYVASNSSVVFRNGTLMNWNNLTGVSEGYPVFSMGGSGKVWVENCHMYSLGTGATQPNIAAVWKDTTASQLCINNTVHSGSDAIGFFVRNSAPAQPVNNVRIMNSRSTKPNDTNITDLLSPTGFVQDPNIIAIGFI